MQSSYRLLCLTPGMPVRILGNVYVVSARLDYSPPEATVAHSHYYYLRDPSNQNTVAKLLVNECTDDIRRGRTAFRLERPMSHDIHLPKFGCRMPNGISCNGRAYHGSKFGHAVPFVVDGNLGNISTGDGLLCDVRYQTATVRNETPQMIRFVSFDLGENWEASKVTELRAEDLTAL